MTTAASLIAISSATAQSLTIKEATPSNTGDWAHSLKTFGEFYKNEDDRFIQEVKFFGRMHWQYASIDGDDVDGNSFENDFTEFRRARVGAKIKFLNN